MDPEAACELYNSTNLTCYDRKVKLTGKLNLIIQLKISST